jgi:GT2 family glycosyltransferase
MPSVCIIILNWNGWRDTIECLESVFRLEYASFRVIVCDNASGDHSLDHIANWASGDLIAECSNLELQHLTSPPCAKPIPFLRIEPGELATLETRSEKLFLVQTGANLGFAGGNNVGLRIALGDGGLVYVWLLNNDTVVEPGALSSLVATMQERPHVGMCGSTLLYYHSPRTVQALGGSTFNRWTARVGHIGLGRDIEDPLPCREVEEALKYVVGASMMVSRPFLDQIGLMNEQYFLYFEEIDWTTRAKGKFSMSYCSRSVVYHKEGGSTGSAPMAQDRSALTELYGSRSRILFTRTYYPSSLITVLLAVLMSALHRLLTRQNKNFLMLLRGMSLGLLARKGTTPSSVSMARSDPRR